MNWRNYLRNRTRQPAFLWRMVLSILVLGVVFGYLAESYFFSGLDFTSHGNPSGGENWSAIERLAEAGQWWEVWWRIPKQIYYGYGNWGPLVLAVCTGVCWFTFLAQVVAEKPPRFERFALMLVGVAFGVLSIWPTGFFIVWQEIGWGLQDSQDLIPGLRYNILGIGLREEAAKLICLMPLLVLLRNQREILALVVSACVGLGFAIEENVGYFFREEETTAMGRYLIANPLHMALTGIVGLTIHRALRYPRDWGPHAVAMFGLVVVAHGVYDAAIMVPAIREYGLIGMIVFALVVYQFFRELRNLRTTSGDVVSLTANFLCGVSLLTAATFIYLSATQGFSAAGDLVTSEALGLSIMVYLFLREMPESMIDV